MSVILYIVYRTTFCLSMGFIKIRQMFCQPAGNGLPLGDTASLPYDKFTFACLTNHLLQRIYPEQASKRKALFLFILALWRCTSTMQTPIARSSPICHGHMRIPYGLTYCCTPHRRLKRSHRARCFFLRRSIAVSAKAFAKSVEIYRAEGCACRATFFDMNAGETQVKIVQGRAEHLCVRSVYDIGRV